MSEAGPALREAALRLLARREHSRRELAQKLRRRFPDIPGERLEAEIKALAEAGYQSDERRQESRSARQNFGVRVRGALKPSFGRQVCLRQKAPKIPSPSRFASRPSSSNALAVPQPMPKPGRSKLGSSLIEASFLAHPASPWGDSLGGFGGLKPFSSVPGRPGHSVYCAAARAAPSALRR